MVPQTVDRMNQTIPRCYCSSASSATVSSWGRRLGLGRFDRGSGGCEIRKGANLGALMLRVRSSILICGFTFVPVALLKRLLVGALSFVGLGIVGHLCIYSFHSRYHFAPAHVHCRGYIIVQCRLLITIRLFGPGTGIYVDGLTGSSPHMPLACRRAKSITNQPRPNLQPSKSPFNSSDILFSRAT